MKRSELLKSREYWIVQIQNDLFQIIHDYMAENHLNQTDLAEKLNVTKGYISQILKGDFDHKISKLVDLALAAGKAPIIHYTDLNKLIHNDACDKKFVLTEKPVQYFHTGDASELQKELHRFKNSDSRIFAQDAGKSFVINANKDILEGVQSLEIRN